MKFVLTENPKNLEDYLVERIDALTANDKTLLLLLPGGSNINVAISALERIQGPRRRSITLALTDERYGAVGHPDSNLAQYIKAGINELKYSYLPVISGNTTEVETEKFAHQIESLIATHDNVLVFTGLGQDGHITGILPNSIGLQSNEYAVHYDGGQYERITTTVKALEQATEIIIGAYGDSKKPTLTSLRDETLDPNVQPAQELKRMPNVSIFNDQIGEKL